MRHGDASGDSAAAGTRRNRARCRPFYPQCIMPDRLPIAVLVSGSGTNLQAILDASATPGYSADVVVVISDRPGVEALDRAAAAGVATEVVAWTHTTTVTISPLPAATLPAFTTPVRSCLPASCGSLPPSQWPGSPIAFINTHPALLPAFPGAHAVPQALAHGVKLTGVTIHFVDEEVDHGPIIYQEAVPVSPATPKTDLQSPDSGGRAPSRIRGHRCLLPPTGSASPAARSTGRGHRDRPARARAPSSRSGTRPGCCRSPVGWSTPASRSSHREELPEPSTTHEYP